MVDPEGEVPVRWFCVCVYICIYIYVCVVDTWYSACVRLERPYRNSARALSAVNKKASYRTTRAVGRGVTRGQSPKGGRRGLRRAFSRAWRNRPGCVFVLWGRCVYFIFQHTHVHTCKDA